MHAQRNYSVQTLVGNLFIKLSYRHIFEVDPY